MSFENDIYRLSYIKRYSNVPKLHEESVAEHGFFVGALLMKLKEQYEFDLGRALEMAIAHDMPEMELNDCPHIIKKKYPSIAKAYEDCEQEVIKTLPYPIQDAVTEFEEQQSVEAKMVNLADAMQCVQFARTEVNLGNRGYMHVVLTNSIKRVSHLKLELTEYECRGNGKEKN